MAYQTYLSNLERRTELVTVLLGIWSWMTLIMDVGLDLWALKVKDWKQVEYYKLLYMTKNQTDRYIVLDI